MYGEALCTVFLLSLAGAAKILGVFMTTSHSHQIVFQPIWRELSLRGHQVTVYTPNPLNDPSLTNLTEIDLGFSNNVWKEKYLDSMMDATNSRRADYQKISEAFSSLFESQMSSPPMQDLIWNRNNETYDLFLVEFFYPGMYGFKDVYKCPMVGILSVPMTIAGASSIGMDKHPVLDPELLLAFATDLTFKERVISTVYNLLYKATMALSAEPKFNALARKYFGENSREPYKIAKEVSVVLGNSNFVTQNIKPVVPAFVDISGIHLQPEKPLPKDLKDLLDNAKEGVIYFSLGTNVKPYHMPKQKLQQFLDAFAELPYKVLWKAEGDIVHNRSNIVTRKWFPQQDILRHPNVRLFITQGGLQSIDESLQGKTPMLMIPFYADQFFNARKMIDNGVALSIDYEQFTKEELVDKIKKLTQDQKYKKAVTEMSTIAVDQPPTASRESRLVDRIRTETQRSCASEI
ncbi:hypothetical protein NQ318_012225 [Aromia moschata]|uniref:UDP-glucuronosyltransferase n=1 Tax=Aromia moschata TaxID=1265417 RepID=A0AAV8YIZ4_9CUCU|nr:hypothetical protein NQ318_012225 [Aromia moschata]